MPWYTVMVSEDESNEPRIRVRTEASDPYQALADVAAIYEEDA